MNFVSIFLSCMSAMATIRNPEAAFLFTTSTPMGTGDSGLHITEGNPIIC